MPQALAYLPELVASTFEVGTSSAVITAAVAATYAVEVAGLALIAASLAPKTPSPDAMRQTFRQPIPQRRRGCGHARFGGPYLMDYASNGVLERVIAAADCKISNVDHYWMHQDEVRVDGGVVQSLPNGAYDSADQRVKVAFSYGQTGVQAFPALHGEVGDQWPATNSGTGIFMVWLRCQQPKLEYFAHDYPHGQDPQFNAAGDIDVFFDWRNEHQVQGDATTWGPSSNPVICLVNELWRYRNYDWDLEISPALDILTAEANVCDEPVPIKVILAKVTQDVATGANNVHLNNVDGLVDGKTIYIGGQEFTVSGVPGADAQGGYLVDLAGGTIIAPLATGAVASWDSDPANPVMRPRYSVGGLWNADEAESDTVKRLLEAMDGFMARRPSDNAVIILAGHWIEPTITLGADELIDYTWQPYLDAGFVNELVPAIVSPAFDYTQVDTTPWRDEDDITARGQTSSQAFAPDLVQENNQVMRLAKAKLARLLATTETFKFKASALRALGYRWIRLQAGLDELSDLADVVLEIVDDYKIADNGMSVVFKVKKASSGVYDFDYQTEEGDGPSGTERPYNGPLPQPTIVSVTVAYEPIGSGAEAARLAIATTGPLRSDLNWSWRWRVQGDSEWRDTTTNQTTGGVVTLTTDYVPAGTIEVATAYMTGVGTLSPWSDTSTVVVSSQPLNMPDAGFGTLASQDEVDWATQVTGVGKPADGATKSLVYRSEAAPETPGVDDIWVKLDADGHAIAMYAWSGAAWVLGADVTAVSTALNTSNVGSQTADQLIGALSQNVEDVLRQAASLTTFQTEQSLLNTDADGNTVMTVAKSAQNQAAGVADSFNFLGSFNAGRTAFYLDTEFSRINGDGTSLGGFILQTQTSFGSLTASIEEQGVTINGIKALWTLKVQAVTDAGEALMSGIIADAEGGPQDIAALGFAGQEFFFWDNTDPSKKVYPATYDATNGWVFTGIKVNGSLIVTRTITAQSVQLDGFLSTSSTTAGPFYNVGSPTVIATITVNPEGAPVNLQWVIDVANGGGQQCAVRVKVYRNGVNISGSMLDMAFNNFTTPCVRFMRDTGGLTVNCTYTLEVQTVTGTDIGDTGGSDYDADVQGVTFYAIPSFTESV